MIRVATNEDVEQMLVLWRQLENAQGPFRVFPLAHGAEAKVAHDLSEALENPDARIVVADDAGTLVGMAVGWFNARAGHLDTQPLADLARVVVSPDRRGEGIGVALVGDIEDWARARGARWLQAHLFSGNEHGRAFWEHVGFIPRYEARVRQIAPREGDPT